MQTLLIVFISIALLISVFCVGIIIYDIVIELRNKKQTKTHNEQELVSSIATMNLSNSLTTNDENGNVTFAPNNIALSEKYQMLSKEEKTYYDEIIRFAKTIKNSKRYKKESCEEFRLGKRRFLRLKIRRGVIICELMIPNLQFKNYVSSSKASIKQAPVIVKVNDANTLSIAKDSIQIAVNAIEEEKAYKKEQAKLRQKKHRQELTNSKTPIMTK